jgi:hypothetical protein
MQVNARAPSGTEQHAGLLQSSSNDSELPPSSVLECSFRGGRGAPEEPHSQDSCQVINRRTALKYASEVRQLSVTTIRRCQLLFPSDQRR